MVHYRMNISRVRSREQINGFIRTGMESILLFGNMLTSIPSATPFVSSMSGLWGPQTALDLYLQEEGIQTLFFAGVNADQVCMQGLPSHTPLHIALNIF